jgi:tetratricopeptide (TPR) repeat protein
MKAKEPAQLQRRVLKGGTLPHLAIAVGVAVVAYTPALSNGFVNWDDDAYVISNLIIRELSLANLWDMFSRPHFGLYQPITLLSLALDFQVGETSPFWYHLVNVLIHGANAGLVYLLIHSLISRRGVSLITAVLFALHPLHVESVAWVTERKDVLYSLFFFASLISYVRYASGGRRTLYYVALSLFLLSLLSKVQAVSLSVTLIAADFALGRSLRDGRVWLEKTPFLALSLVFGIVGLLAVRAAGASPGQTSDGIMIQSVYATYAFAQYVVRLVMPLGLSAVYPYPVRADGGLPFGLWLYPLLLFGVAVAFMYSVRRSRIVAFGIAFFIINIALVLQVTPVGTAFMADRFSYVPSVGAFLIVGVGYQAVTNRFSGARWPARGVLAAYALALSILTFQRSLVWRDSLSLWNDVLSKFPSVPVAYNNRGAARAEQGGFAAAMLDYDKAIQLKPDYAKAYNNRGSAKISMGQYEDAIAELDEAIRLEPDYASAYYNRGLANDYLGDTEAAISDYDRAIELNPDFVDAFYSRAGALGNVGQLDRALRDYDRAIELNPRWAKAYANRGTLKRALGDLRGACLDWQTAGALGEGSATERRSQYCGQ